MSEASKHGPRVHIATIVAAHGLKGEVKVKPFTADPKAFTAYGALQTADGRSFEVKRLRAQADHFICTLSNVTDRNAAEGLRGVQLFVARESLPPAKTGEVYLADVQGKEAVVDGKALGRIIGFQNFGAGELMELGDGTLIPVSFIASVDDKVHFTLPEGYLDAE